MHNENETQAQTETDNHVSAIEDLTLHGVAATQVRGGVSDPRNGNLYLGTDRGVYRNSSAGTFTLTFNGQTTASSVFGQPVTFTATVQSS
jgi:hypothetical protein